MQDQTPGPIELEVFRHLFTALAEEMGAALRRTAFSPNIKERRDYSCALFDPRGRAVALGDHMPVHLGAMPMSVTRTLEILGELRSGDVACLNDPFHGGTHLPDVTLVTPVHEDGALLGYVASRAHHSDVGGIRPGSMPLATEIFQEGLRIPPVKLMEGGRRNASVWSLILANVRTPRERAGDLAAQMAALNTGTRRLREIVGRKGGRRTLAAMEALMGYGDQLMARGLERIPDGVYRASDAMEDDGFDPGPLPIRVEVTIRGERARVDFSGSAPQVRGGVNAVEAITHSATRYVFRCVAEAILGVPLPAGGGPMERVEVVLPEGSIVNARPPASVAAGNVETSQRITDVLLQAFARALPGRIPALSQGTMNNLTVGGRDPRTGEPFTYYETMGGGLGAGPGGPGLSGVHSHMSNSLNTPVEALEHAYPFRIRHYGIRRGTGGAPGGTGDPAGNPVGHPGGDGLRRDLEILCDAEVTLLTERRRSGPPGRGSGGSGAPGENVLIREGEEHRLPAKVTLDVRTGDVLSLRSPGGGGWGPESQSNRP